MRLVVVLLLAWVAGCTPLSGSRGNSWLKQMNPFAGAPGERVVLRTFLIEQAAGDPYLSDGLWRDAHKPIAPERSALLLENGIRVGVLTGNPPYQFLDLIRGDSFVIKPLQQIVPVGEARPVPLNGPLTEVSFQSVVEIGGAPGSFTLKDAETAMNLSARPEDGGKIRVTLEPRVQHGSRQFGYRPTIDATGFTWLDQKVQERFPNLQFDAAIAPGEYLIIGPGDTPAGTLGGACFMAVDERVSRMRVLVVQAAVFSEPPKPPGKKGQAIAAQAGTPLARGQRP